MTPEDLKLALARSFEPEPELARGYYTPVSVGKCWQWTYDPGRDESGWQPRDFTEPEMTVMMLESHMNSDLGDGNDFWLAVKDQWMLHRNILVAIREATARARGVWHD